MGKSLKQAENRAFCISGKRVAKMRFNYVSPTPKSGTTPKASINSFIFDRIFAAEEKSRDWRGKI
jgi:hypothetical protein